MMMPENITCVDHGGGNLDLYLDDAPPVACAPELPIIGALRFQQEREDWALQIARQRLGVTPEEEFKSPAVHEAVLVEKARVIKEHQ